MIKLIVSDMDGTLLNDFWRISEENEQAIKRAQAQGIQFMVATGRPYENAHFITEKVGIFCPVVGLNGATTHDANGQLIAHEAMTRQEVKIIIDILNKHRIYFELMTSHGAFSIDFEGLHEMMFELGDRELAHLPKAERDERVLHLNRERIKNENCQFITSFDTVLNNEAIHIYKVFSMSPNDEAIALAAKELEALNTFAVTSAGHMNLEINSMNGHKGYAVFHYAESLGIKPEEVMTIGDNFNDLTMLLKAGRGVAMGNAHEDIKQQCRYTTKNNLEHGVAHAINQMLDEQA